jgi:PqqD family protein of HPr-rel-A system
MQPAMSTAYRKNAKVEESAMKAESLLFDPASNQFCMLNETAALLWQRLEQPATVEQLADAVCEAFDGVERDQARRDVETLLRRLDDLKLVVAE